MSSSCGSTRTSFRDDALAAAWADFKAHPSKYSYADLVRYVPKAQRVAWHNKAMDAAAGADLHSLIELWLETREIDRLVDRLRTARDEEIEGLSHYATERVAKRLAKTHADVAAKVYRALGMRILKAKKSKYYDAALSSFEDARRCYERAGLAAKWEGLVSEVRGGAPPQDGVHARLRRVGGRPRSGREADVPRAREGTMVAFTKALTGPGALCNPPAYGGTGAEPRWILPRRIRGLGQRGAHSSGWLVA